MMDLSTYVLKKLQFGHKINAVVEAGLVKDFVKTPRILALVEGPSSKTVLPASQVLFVYNPTRVPVQSYFDLCTEKVLLVDSTFKCEIDSTSADAESDVLVNITAGKMRLLFEMHCGQQTNSFVSEVMRAGETVGKQKGPPPDFLWAQAYINLEAPTSLPTTHVEDIKPAFTSIPDGDGRLTLDAASLLDVSSQDQTTLCSQYSSLELSPILPENSDLHDCEKTTELTVNRHNIAKGLSPTPIAARESHIRHQMSLREESYTDVHSMTVFVGTWNVNGQLPTVGLAEWLSVDDEPPDVYAVGFQELDLNKEAFLFNNSPREQEWLNSILNGIHPKAKYHKVRLVRLVGMMLVVLVQEKHFAYVRNVAVDSVGTGIMNKMGNKGAVSIRMDLHSTSICFTNAHLAAHMEEFERRNEDHDCILQRTTFNLNINSPPKSIKDHEHIYFFGDMNYRINNKGDFNAKELSDKGHFKILLENDQLNVQRHCKRIFNSFQEGEITFKPSYRYDLFTDNWDSSEKMRDPAWTDRILWKGDGISQLVYRSHMSLKISDHKPISSLFNAGIKVIDSRRYRRIYEEVMKKLDKLENEFLPQVTVDTTEFILEPVKFLQPQTKYLTIANTGQVPVQFEFIKKLNDSSYCKPWLSIRPYVNFIMPGDKCDVALEVLVDKKTAAQLNSGADKLYDILVLHLEGGKDLFITITGDYERSCFGSSINALVHMNQPFKDVSISRIIDLESKQPKVLSELPYAVPKEMWYLVDHLHTHGLDVDGLFTISGLQKEIIEIRSCLDAGVPDNIILGSVHSVAESLLLFIEALPEPVIPYNLYHRALEATPNFVLCQEVVTQMPVYHRNVFTYLMAFLKELLLHAVENGLDARTLALVFGSILLRDPQNINMERRVTQQAVERKKQTFVHHFLVNDYE